MTIPKRLYIDQPSMNVENASTAPTLASPADAGSTLTAGTYYVTYTWVNRHGETKPATEASHTTAIGDRLDVTVPLFPSGVTSANVYISTSSGTEKYQGEITSSGGTFLLLADPSTTSASMPIENTIPILYTIPTGTTTIVKNIILHNTATTDQQVTIRFVLSGETGRKKHQVVSHTVVAKDTVVIDLAGVLHEGDTINGFQSAPDTITVYISGVEV